MHIHLPNFKSQNDRQLSWNLPLPHPASDPSPNPKYLSFSFLPASKPPACLCLIDQLLCIHFAPSSSVCTHQLEGSFCRAKQCILVLLEWKSTTLSWHIKLWNCVWAQFYGPTSRFLPASHASSQFHSENCTGLSFPQAPPAPLHISTFKSAGFLCLYLLPPHESA